VVVYIQQSFMKNLIVQNLKTSYRDSGSGLTLLFLHGWGTSADTFEKLINKFKNHRCISLSLPGFGGSERPHEPWGVLEYAEFVRDFIKKLKIQPDVIIAHSFGGRISIKGVSSNLFNPKKLVLIASAGMARKSIKERAIGGVAKLLKPILSLPFLSGLRAKLRRRFGSDDYKNVGEMRETFLKVINENLENDAQKITTPTLLVWGENDEATPVSEANILHDCIAGSKLHVLKDATHFVFQEFPDEVYKLIEEFL
jgi:pimeloyl-ACP methyl ester carboxylesterase